MLDNIKKGDIVVFHGGAMSQFISRKEGSSIFTDWMYLRTDKEIIPELENHRTWHAVKRLAEPCEIIEYIKYFNFSELLPIPNFKTSITIY